MTTEQEVTEWGARLAAQYGLTVTNQRRTPEHNAAVGGAKHSDHLTGLAIDLSGDPKKMAALGAWAAQNMGEGKLFRWVGWQSPGHYDHVHLSFNAAASDKTVHAASSSEAVMADINDLPPDSTPEQIEAWIRKNLPMAAPFLANPEIRSILVRPDIDELGELEVEQLLRSTTYWQTHGPESRAFDKLIGNDPQAAGQAVDRAKGALGDFLSKKGVTYTDEQLGEAAKKAIRAGWMNLAGQVVDTGALDDFAVFVLGQGQRNLDGTLPSGEAAVQADQLRAIAGAYFVPMTTQDLERWALDIQAGKATAEQFQSEMAWNAKHLFQDPNVQKAIDEGRTPDQIFAPVRNIIAQTLELAPDQVDLMSPRYRDVLQVRDEKAGITRPMTLGEATKWARDQDAFRETREYKSTEANLSVQLARSMGALA